MGAPGRRSAAPAVLLAAAVMAVGVGATGTSAAQGQRVTGAAQAVAADCGPSWTTAWLASPQAGRTGLALDGRTLRMVVRPHVTGPELRIRLSNRYGGRPLVLGPVSAARSRGGAELAPGTAQPVTFAGRGTVEVPPGGEVVSDAVPLAAEAGGALAVSLFLPQRPEVFDAHPVALQTSYVSRPGDFALDADGAPFETAVESWLVLAGVDVLAPRPVNAVVAVGDSITDGYGGQRDADERWTDELFRRLDGTGGERTMAVLNAGISGNQLLVDRPEDLGDSPLTRFDREVAAVPGATDVILHIGTNDVAAGRSSEEIVAGLVRFAERARAAGKRVFLTTVTPAEDAARRAPEAVEVREAVNAWVLRRGREHADGVFDFAAAVADPARPSSLLDRYDAGDGLHLSAAGYRALAAAVDAARLTGSPCLAESSATGIAVGGR